MYRCYRFVYWFLLVVQSGRIPRQPPRVGRPFRVGGFLRRLQGRFDFGLRRPGFQLAHEQRHVANDSKAASSTGAAFFVRVRPERAIRPGLGTLGWLGKSSRITKNYRKISVKNANSLHLYGHGKFDLKQKSVAGREVGEPHLREQLPVLQDIGERA